MRAGDDSPGAHPGDRSRLPWMSAMPCTHSALDRLDRAVVNGAPQVTFADGEIGVPTAIFLGAYRFLAHPTEPDLFPCMFHP